MSSGNPFRASLSRNPASSSPVPQTSFINTNSSVPEAREDGRSGLEDAVAPPPRAKKHVRIESNTTFIPPHPAVDSGDDSPHDTFSSNYMQSQDVRFPPIITTANPPQPDMIAADPSASSAWLRSDARSSDIFSNSKLGSMAPQSAVTPNDIPVNPFSRTLASMEPQERGDEEEKASAEKAASSRIRASMDVESFKNLLMTGKLNQRQSQPQPFAPSGSQFESSSTDTSSISRSSLFEPPQETATADSPRTSYEMAGSDEDERARILSEAKKGKRRPPPTPKHRHGRLVTPRQPETVSFEAFSPSEPASSPITLARDNSDASEPLPPTPITLAPPPRMDSSEAPLETPLSPSQVFNESLPVVDAPVPQKRTPPPVPLARRQSQLRSSGGGNRSRSNSSLTMSSQVSVEGALASPAPSIKDVHPTGKLPPPPPRSRHGAPLTAALSLSANSSTTELPQRSGSVRSTHIPTPQDANLAPRPTIDTEPRFPPSSDLQRTSSVTSNRNTSRIVSGESTSSTMAPPPPPPRRRGGGSGRSSLDQQRPTVIPTSPTDSRRTSTEHRRTSTDSKRRTSVTSESSLRHAYVHSTSNSIDEGRRTEQPLYSPQDESEKTLAGTSQQRSDSSNILDDMEKFQQEIDALRSRFKQSG